MIVLGINGGVRMGYQDIAAALIIDGVTVAAVEEERINRIKHSPGMIPHQSIQAVLNMANIKMSDVDLVVSHGSTWGELYEKVLKEYLIRYFGSCPRIERIHHHIAHAASAWFASGFDQAMILTMDASGDGIALQRAVGDSNGIKVLEQVPRSNSLGIFYSMMTQFCGFTRDTDEYKLMGLAPYGDASINSLDEILEVSDSGYVFNQDFFKTMEPGAPQPTRQQTIYNQKLINLLGEERRPGSEMTQKYKDVAASTQFKLRDAIIAVVKQFHKETGIRKLCLAGGVALNCAVNKDLMNLDIIDDVFVQPASGDNGISLGAAMWGADALGDKVVPPKDVYLGHQFTNNEIQNRLDLMGMRYRSVDDPAGAAAQLVSENKVVAWFQGRAEFGPRALGNRSILGNPQHPEMKSLINAKIKFRESFRPFCPSVLAEDSHLYFKGKLPGAPYMTINYDVHEDLDLPSITHVDGTARIQTVESAVNPLYYDYLQQLKSITGHGVSINTSFNRNREPIVNTPIDAVSAYCGSGMDALIIGDFVLEKA